MKRFLSAESAKSACCFQQSNHKVCHFDPEASGGEIFARNSVQRIANLYRFTSVISPPSKLTQNENKNQLNPPNPWAIKFV
ncbi:hypothetical protein EAH81_22665 [Flavobacterium pectinovorum]|uniref:Uncharacterized protein n=1 Tax=Flavobacterium pectinovorum TaxID=29533 RepID=A0A502EAL0_9FLAO|nr:hypothetical protein EAH81_22665 [Flavobacterium pectinovorum]